MRLPPDVLTSTFCDKKTKIIHLKYYISHAETIEISKLVGDAGILLYTHFLRMASTDQPTITDANSASSLGWTERKARTYRLKLAKIGYFKQVRFTRPDGQKMIIYHIGKESVSNISSSKKRGLLNHALVPMQPVICQQKITNLYKSHIKNICLPINLP